MVQKSRKSDKSERKKCLLRFKQEKKNDDSIDFGRSFENSFRA